MGNMFRCTLKSGGASGTGIPLIVNCSEDFAGKTITATDGTTTLTETCPSTSPYTVQFDLPNTGSWTISGVIEGQTYSETISVTEYQLSLETGFNYKMWVSLGGLDPDDYASLSAVFADEAAVRRLMLVHASADYLIDCVTDDITAIDDFCANDTAMKWLGLCDYVCDGLTAITGVEAKFMASTYWERYLKDHVPVMTSNTAPYGEAGARNAVSGNEAYRAFDGNSGTTWYDNNNSSNNTWIQYKFTNPICVRRMRIECLNSNWISNWTLKGSNDGSTFTTIETGTESASGVYVHNIANDDFYLIYRLECKSNRSDGDVNIASLQFYGRQLNVSVPVMTSNTAPYGEVILSETAASDYPGYYAFDDNSSTMWVPNNTSFTSTKIGYRFTNPTCVKRVKIESTHNSGATNNRVHTAIIQGSNDGTNWVDIQTLNNVENSEYHDITNDNYYLYYYINITATTGNQRPNVIAIQFYGVDYSEKEFEAGTTKKWLYDHGVEPSGTLSATTNSGCTTTKNDDNLYCEVPASANVVAGFYLVTDVTSYNLLRGIVGDSLYCSTASSTAGVIAISANEITGSSQAQIANVACKIADNPNSTLGVDISSVSGSNYVGCRTSNGSSGLSRKVSYKELWME